MSRSDLLTRPPRLPLVFASILGADFSRMAEECSDALAKGADGLHVDVMDGHFVPNLTMGPKMVADLRRRFPEAYLDVHLMVSNPHDFVTPFAKAGADCLTFHIEAAEGRADHDPRAVIRQIRSAGCQVGVAINPPTPAEAVGEVLGDVDMALVMSVHPGFAGQKFITDVLEKARRLRPRLRPHQRLEIDGGLNPKTAPGAREAGCDVIVAASALFDSSDRAATIALLRGKEMRP